MQHSFLKKIHVDKLALLFCLIFGCLLLVFAVSPGDGGWILYGREIISGKKIYTDLHINQQPLFPLLSAGVAFAASNIMYQHLLYFPILLLFCFSIYKLATVSDEPLYVRALMILAVFFLAIRFEAYRFDDYHVLAQALVLYSMGLSVAGIIKSPFDFKKYFLIQGFIFGLALITRVNEGAVIFTGVVATGFLLTRNISIFSKGFVFFGGAAALILLLALALIYESPANWFDHTINRAVGNKGGAGVFYYPLKLFVNSFVFLWDAFNGGLSTAKKVFVISYALLSVAVIFFGKSRLLKYFIILLGLAGVNYIAYKLGVTFASVLIPALVVSIFISLLISIFYALAFKSHNGPKLLLVFIYPLALFSFGSLSSGGRFQDLTFPAAASIALTPVVLMLLSLKADTLRVARFFMVLVFSILFVEGLYQRSRLPFAWHSYNVPYLFSSEYRFDEGYKFGPLLLSKQVGDLVKPVCNMVGNGKTLLSLPFSFANYYCDIPVWNGYVQSFFDTAGPVLVSDMLGQLQRNPPDYIFYQRQILNLSVHEELFNGGHPLPHRKLDAFIIEKINLGEWSVVYRSDLFPPSEWLLIKTAN